jgi:hypothetical protein
MEMVRSDRSGPPTVQAGIAFGQVNTHAPQGCDRCRSVRVGSDENDIIASQSIGFLGHYSGRRIVSLDGLLNSTNCYREYLTAGESGQYLRENGVSLIAQSLRRDVEAVGYMAEVLGVDRSDLRIEAEFDDVSHVPRRYLIFRLSP